MLKNLKKGVVGKPVLSFLGVPPFFRGDYVCCFRDDTRYPLQKLAWLTGWKSTTVLTGKYIHLHSSWIFQSAMLVYRRSNNTTLKFVNSESNQDWKQIQVHTHRIHETDGIFTYMNAWFLHFNIHVSSDGSFKKWIVTYQKIRNSKAVPAGSPENMISIIPGAAPKKDTLED